MYSRPALSNTVKRIGQIESAYVRPACVFLNQFKALRLEKPQPFAPVRVPLYSHIT
jgi:hypothetical protein